METHDYLSALPDEILHMIISHLNDPGDVASLECANRLFCGLCRDVHLWRAFFAEGVQVTQRKKVLALGTTISAPEVLQFGKCQWNV